MILYGPPGHGQDDAGADHRRGRAGRVRGGDARSTPARRRCATVIERAAHRRQTTGEPTIFFLDEIHRFNKAQQDALLPAVEEGLVTLIGRDDGEPVLRGQLRAALARAGLRAAPADDAEQVRRPPAARARPRRVRRRDRRSTTTSLEFLAARAGGDARAALAALELACETAGAGEPRSRSRHAEDAMQRKALRYDREGDQHYDTISAWIKATRGSDPDASLLLPRGHARGRRGPALHRAADGDPRLRGRRQRRPAGARGRGRRRAGGRARRPARGAVQPRPGGDLPVAGAEVERGVKASIGAARGHVREHGAKPPPDHLRIGRLRAGRSAPWAAARATTTRTTTRGISPSRSSCPRGSRASASTSRPTPRPRCRSACSGSAARGAGRDDVISVTRTKSQRGFRGSVCEAEVTGAMAEPLDDPARCCRAPTSFRPDRACACATRGAPTCPAADRALLERRGIEPTRASAPRPALVRFAPPRPAR